MGAIAGLGAWKKVRSAWRASTVGIEHRVAGSAAAASFAILAGMGVLIAQNGGDEPFLPNLIGNPSFESGISGWSPYGGAKLQRVKGGFHGAYALEVRGPEDLVPFGAQDGSPWVASAGPKGTHYRASAWVRSSAHGGRVVMRIRESVNGKEVGISRQATLALSSEWQLLVAEYVILKAGSQLELQIVDQPRARSEVFRTDNITILAVPSAEMLENRGKRAPLPPAPSGDLS